jgi:molecular chaperone DnaK
VAILEGGEATVIHNQEGGRTTPSMVSWTADGSVLVGAAAKRQMVTNPNRTVFGVKRLIGRKSSDAEVTNLTDTLPYKVVPARQGDAWVEIDGQAHSPPEISAHVLAKLKQVAEDYLGEEVTEAVVTVPAYFDDVQRQATKDAGTIAGLTVRAILNEPTAAALAYGAQKEQSQRIAVFDLGGGTFDISILSIENGVFEVLATSGDTALGGDDFDRVVIDLIASKFARESAVDLRRDPMALQRLKEAAERAKIELSSAMSTDVNLPFVAAGASGPLHLRHEISRSELEKACRQLLDRLEGPCTTALGAARCTVSDVDQVVLVGGMTRMPAVQERAMAIFGRPPSKNVNPDEIVAMGAAVHSGILGGELTEIVLLDVTPHALGVRVAGDRMSVVIPANESVPTRATKVLATTEDNQNFVAIEIYQGPHDNVAHNRRLGRFVLGDLKLGPKGSTRVEVAFTMNADGILQVSATELGTGRETTVTVEASGGLSPAELTDLGEKFQAR